MVRLLDDFYKFTDSGPGYLRVQGSTTLYESERKQD